MMCTWSPPYLCGGIHWFGSLWNFVGCWLKAFGKDNRRWNFPQTVKWWISFEKMIDCASGVEGYLKTIWKEKEVFQAFWINQKGCRWIWRIGQSMKRWFRDYSIWRNNEMGAEIDSSLVVAGALEKSQEIAIWSGLTCSGMELFTL